MKKADFPSLTDLYFKYKTEGALSGTFDFGGIGADQHAMHGAGKIEVTNGDVFAIPVFGPLSGLVNKIFPARATAWRTKRARPSRSRRGHSHRRFQSLGQTLRDARPWGPPFRREILDFDIRIDAEGPGVLLTPVYKLFEYKGEGSLAKPTGVRKDSEELFGAEF